MKTTICIDLNKEGDGLVGPRGWEYWHPQRSIAKYQQMVLEDVQEGFPQACVRVTSNGRGADYIEITGEAKDVAQEVIEHIIAQVWDSFEWLVEEGEE